jgi:hypothetical protein
MRNSFQFRCNSAAKRCAICEGKFGLVRYYSWRTALCSKQCLTASRPVERTTADSCLEFRPPDNGRGETPAAISRSSGFWSKEIAQ